MIAMRKQDAAGPSLRDPHVDNKRKRSQFTMSGITTAIILVWVPANARFGLV